MIDLTSEDLKNLFFRNISNPYKNCWESMKDIVSNNSGSSLMSESEYADGRRTAYQEMYKFMEILEKNIVGKDEEE